MSATPTLKKALSQRQLTMIAIGGVIGAGLFVGSGVVIKDTGPGAFITYALAGVLIIMVMRMLAEMAVANPSTGSFADYARNALGNWAGFSVGWLYWYFWVIVVGFEAIAGAKIIQYWVDIPLWLSALVLLVLMTGDQPVLGVVVRRVRVLVRRYQGGRDHRVHRARLALRSRLVAAQVDGLLQPVEPWRVLPAGRRRDHRRRGHGDLLDGGCRDRDDRRRGIVRPGEGGGQGRQLGDPADCDLLRRLDLPAGDDPAVERREACRLPVRRPRSPRWGFRMPTTS